MEQIINERNSFYENKIKKINRIYVNTYKIQLINR